MTLSDAQAAVSASPAHTNQEQTTASGIPLVEVSRFRWELWAVTTNAMFLSWNTTPLSEEEMTYLATQLGELLRYLARRHIYPIDKTGEVLTDDDQYALLARKDVRNR